MRIQQLFKNHIGDWIIAASAVVLIVIALLFAAAAQRYPTGPGVVDDVIDFIVAFGGEMKNVSLLAPPADVKAAMETHYGKYVSPELLALWEANPASAPGRTTSSPWPDAIRVKTVQTLSVGSFVATGFIVERTSTGTTTTQRPVTFGVTRTASGWRITEYVGPFPQ